jgi:hypothetical protein
MARKMIRRYIVQALEDLEEASTGEIVEHVCRSYKWGVSINQVGNLLARYPDFEKVGFIDETSEDTLVGIRCRQAVWRLANA